MKKFLISLTLIILTGCSNGQPNYAEYWQSWGDDRLAQWQLESIEFDAQVSLFCAGNSNLNQLQNDWHSLAISWASLNGLPYHAIADLSLSFELYFWPDKRDMTTNRLHQRLAQGGEYSAEHLAKATAAEKGLLAMEWLSFEPDIAQELRCNILPTISAHYRSNIERITDYHQTHPLVQPNWIDEQNSPEGLSISLNLLFQQLAQISNRLHTSVNKEGQLVPILAEGWRSSSSTQIYLSSLNTTIKHLHMLTERTATTENTQGLIQAQIVELQEMASEMEMGTYNWLKLQQSIIDTEHLIEEAVAQDLDILIGFNNYDGD